MKHVLIVGPCYADSKAIRKELLSKFKLRITEFSEIDEAKELLLNKETKTDLILVSRKTNTNENAGIELLDFMKKNKFNVPVILLTRFKEIQENAKEKGAIASFDMDLLIGYIPPSKKEAEKEAMSILEKILNN